MKTAFLRLTPLFLALCLLPVFGASAFAATGHVDAGMTNYPLIIGCVVGGALVVFLVSALLLKHKRK